jgi:tyrosinase
MGTRAASRAILSGVILLMAVPGCRAAGNQQMDSKIVAAAAKAVALPDGEVTVTLRASGQRTLAARADALPDGQHLFLVAGDLRADEQPGVVYQVYLDLPRDGKASDRGERHVGYVNFYNAQVGSVRGSAENELTFDVTDVVKNLRKRGQLPDSTTVTFVPDGKAAARAGAVIGRLEILAQ